MNTVLGNLYLDLIKKISDVSETTVTRVSDNYILKYDLGSFQIVVTAKRCSSWHESGFRVGDYFYVALRVNLEGNLSDATFYIRETVGIENTFDMNGTVTLYGKYSNSN